MRNFLILILLIISNISLGQEDLTHFNFTSMVNFGTFEQTQASGSVGVDLPLYHIDCPNFEYTLGLKYNLYGNVNVNSDGGQFGDAWNLNIIGSVIRKTKYNSVQEYNIVEIGIYDYMNAPIHSSITMEQYKYGPRIYDEYFYTTHPSVNDRNNADRDLFEFSIPGLSGKFFIYKNSGEYKARLLESSDYCSISVLSSPSFEYIDSFVITDKHGYKYVLDVKNNINENKYFDVVKGPAIGQTYFSAYKYLNFSNNLGNLNPAANGNGTGFNGTVYAQEHFGKEFWESMNLTKIYDPYDNLILSIEYDSFEKPWIDYNYTYTTTGGYRKIDALVIDNITIPEIGKLLFENAIINGEAIANHKKITKKISFKDTQGNLIKTIDFNYQNIQYGGNHGDKVLLSQIEDFSNTSQPLLTELSYKDYPPENIRFYDGYAIKSYFKPDYMGSEYFRADYRSLQKIKYPTGGTKLYSFEPNTIHCSDEYAKNNNLDNQIFTDLPVTDLGGQEYKIHANQGDILFILVASDSELEFYKDNNGSLTFLQFIKNNEFYDPHEGQRRYAFAGDHYYNWTKLTVESSGDYLLKYQSSYFNYPPPQVVKMVYKPTNEIKKYKIIEGLRIKEIAYFKDDVNTNLLEIGDTSDAEKYTLFDYSDENRNSSSGRDQRITPSLPHPNAKPVFYNRVTVRNRAVGKQINVYNTEEEIPLFTRLKSVFTYDNSNVLIEEKHFERQHQWYTDTKKHADIVIEPFDLSVNQTTKTYEGTSFTEQSNEVTYDLIHRYPTEVISTLPAISETLKQTNSYSQIGDVFVKTASEGFLNGTKVSASAYHYNSHGDLLYTETAKSTLPLTKAGNEITRITNGRVEEYKQPDGTYVSRIWGYNNTEVVAELKNLRYSQIASGTITNIKNSSKLSGYNETALVTALNGLRTAHPTALITTYIYTPMVGLKTTTDANGRKETYQYDNFNRLYRVLNHEGNIVKEYHYNIKN